MTFGIPLAWLQLKREKLRMLVAVAGVTFAVTLIFMQLGFRNAMLDSAVRLHRYMAADLVVISPDFPFLAQPASFSRRRLYQARSFDGVESVSAVYAGLTLWRNPFNSETRTIFILGIDPTDHALTIPEVVQQLDVIRKPDIVLFDAASRPEYGPVAAELQAGRTVSAEVAHRRVTVEGLFQLGTSFGIDGTLVTSDLNFLRIFPLREPGVIDFGLIRLRPGVDPVVLRDALAAHLPNDVTVLTMDGLIKREQNFWESCTPIGFVFAFGVIMGFVVGAIIVYQILFADVSDHLAEYATLKAMGYPNRYLFSVVLQEALILAVLGYIPGYLICLRLYRVTENATNLPMQLTLQVALLVLGVTIVMCALSGVFALRKIRSADPAEIF